MRVELRRDLGPKTYDGWLAPGVTAFRLNGTGLVVLARSGFMADWVKTHYEDRLAMLARSHGLGGVRIEGVK
jgi:chromosomal replication initiation ATPase DnaA